MGAFTHFFRWMYWFVFYRNIPVTIINDCRDENARGRQQVRAASFFPGSHITFIGVENDFEAALHLVDIIDAYQGKRGVILVNIAPRQGPAKRWENGTPFGVMNFHNTIIFTTIDGVTLGLLAKISAPASSVSIFDVPSITPFFTTDLILRAYIKDSQFRSFDFLPRAAATYLRGHRMPVETLSLSCLVDADQSVIAYIDCFGNIKTTLFPEEVGFQPGANIGLQIGESVQSLQCYRRLKDIPDGVLGLIIGSSGFRQRRFLEIAVQGGRADAHLNAQIGTPLRRVV